MLLDPLTEYNKGSFTFLQANASYYISKVSIGQIGYTAHMSFLWGDSKITRNRTIPFVIINSTFLFVLFFI